MPFNFVIYIINVFKYYSVIFIMLYWISMLFTDTVPRVENKKQNLKLSEIFLLIFHHYPYWTRKKENLKQLGK